MHSMGSHGTHTPPWQVSTPLQTRLSSQLEPSTSGRSARHEGSVPEQSSATSHGPFAGRQLVLAGRSSSNGQAAPAPVQ